MKTFAAFALMAALAGVPASAQKLNLNFDAIAKNAKEKTELSLTGPMLNLLKQKAAQAGGLEGKQALFAGIDQLAVYNYEFAKRGEYADSDLDPLRRQVAGSTAWSPVLNVKEKGEDTWIYVSTQGDKQTGFLIISAEPKEVTVVLVSGSIQLAQLEELVNSSIHFKDLAQE
jgi:hypothetical protein